MSNAPVELAAAREGRVALELIAAQHPGLVMPESQLELNRYLSGPRAGARLLFAINPRYLDETMPAASTERFAINLRLTPELVAAVSEAEAAIPALSRHAICLAALGIGLAALAEDPALAMLQNVRGKAPAKKRSKRARGPA